MKIVLGIGNPGFQYQYTKHNIGFDAIDCVVEKLKLFPKTKFNAVYYEYTTDKGEKVLFIKPQNFVNLSGEVLIKFVKYYKVDIHDILIISDDLDHDVGVIKLKAKGSSGGHNGLKSIEHVLNSKEYKRIKVGISNDKSMDTASYVLSRFSQEDREIINNSLNLVKNIIMEWINGITFCRLQDKYNKSC